MGQGNRLRALHDERVLCRDTSPALTVKSLLVVLIWFWGFGDPRIGAQSYLLALQVRFILDAAWGPIRDGEESNPG